MFDSLLGIEYFPLYKVIQIPEKNDNQLMKCPANGGGGGVINSFQFQFQYI